MMTTKKPYKLTDVNRQLVDFFKEIEIDEDNGVLWCDPSFAPLVDGSTIRRDESLSHEELDILLDLFGIAALIPPLFVFHEVERFVPDGFPKNLFFSFSKPLLELESYLFMKSPLSVIYSIYKT